MNEHFANAALMIVGHGSMDNSGASAPVFQHADELRRRGLFVEVREGFWKQAPRMGEVLGSIDVPTVFIVPFFASEGYFADEKIPQELGLRATNQKVFSRVCKRGLQTLFYCHPVGTHKAMGKVIVARAREVVLKNPCSPAPRSERIVLVIAGHGTEKNENSRRAIEQQVENVRSRGEYAEVRAGFLEEKPHVQDCYRSSPANDIVVVPFFMGTGGHVQDDLPVLLGESPADVQKRLHDGQQPWRNPAMRNGRHVWLAEIVGSEPSVVEVILERVREAARLGRTHLAL